MNLILLLGQEHLHLLQPIPSRLLWRYPIIILQLYHSHRAGYNDLANMLAENKLEMEQMKECR